VYDAIYKLLHYLNWFANDKAKVIDPSVIIATNDTNDTRDLHHVD